MSTNLLKCSDCGGQVSKHASQCPHCGRVKRGKAVKFSGMIEALGVIILIFGIMLLVLSLAAGISVIFVGLFFIAASKLKIRHKS